MLGLLRSLARAAVRRDDASRFQLLTDFGAKVFPKYRFHWPQMDWWNDAEFNAYLAKIGELPSFNTERKWTLAQLLRLVAHVPGDTAECGVNLGASSYLICRANAASRQEKWHHGFDSFEGLSQPGAQDGSFWKGGDLAVSLETAAANLAGFSRCRLYKGWIPERFPEVAGRSFSFVHVDVDIYEPTKASVEFFYPRLAVGGLLVCDDYGFTTCPGATRSIDEFLKDKPEKMIALADGGGVFIKGVRV
ncbi:MAG TPA: TylF/MycF/NovP-related O-methyltransferase [Candidatus Polarisedimenticolaceae bacterium]|nr:TylF/MycF/NovP-related O-methyltransferase [Candidatus Polarisedimenticolaceae bacterium]